MRYEAGNKRFTNASFRSGAPAEALVQNDNAINDEEGDFFDPDQRTWDNITCCYCNKEPWQHGEQEKAIARLPEQ